LPNLTGTAGRGRQFLHFVAGAVENLIRMPEAFIGLAENS
jgi:hypothetical protein